MVDYEYFQPDPMHVPFLDDHELLAFVVNHQFKSVFHGTVNATDISTALEMIFSQHNRDDRPRAREIPSMSIGCIVKIQEKYYVCAMVSWLPVESHRIKLS
jgi:hypothetical protein